MRVIRQKEQRILLKEISPKNDANNLENPNKLTKNLNNKVLPMFHR